MSTPQWQPDIVVGIDFGMTCTGVAWSSGPDWHTPKTLQHWPGKLGHELRNKVDTAVSYHAKTGELAHWGFLCNADDPQYEHNELFKLYLDRNYADPTGSGPTLQEARAWFRDYLRCLRQYIIQHFEQSLARFASKRLEFLFSVPTTWKDPSQLAVLEDLIRQAGYGQLNKERALVYLTEAEAAAVYTSKQSLEQGDVFLVCDAGGGTTDLNVLKVKSSTPTKLQLTPLGWTEGRAAGSALIDYRVQRLIAERLRRIPGYPQSDLDSIAATMMLDKFNAFKCSLGSDDIKVLQISMPVPSLTPGTDLAAASVEDSKMILTSKELSEIFDEQFAKITKLIDEQLTRLQQTSPAEDVSYLVMSGGLGTSGYIRKRIKERYENGKSSMECARNMKLLLADEPQLAVVHGLVLARTQASKGGPQIYGQRCCPVSYGIVCRQKYDPQIHHGEDLIKDPYSKAHWAENQITWIVRQGDLVLAEEGARQRYRMKLAKGQEQQSHVVNIVMSALPPDQLPRSMKHPGAKSVCDIEFHLTKTDIKAKRRWYDPGSAYHEAEFDVRLIIGTGLRFEVWGGQGIRSKTHEEITVQWMSPDAMENVRSLRRSELYRA